MIVMLHSIQERPSEQRSMTTTLGSLQIPACRVDSGAEEVLAQVEDLGLGVSCAEHRRRNLRAKLVFAT